MLKNSLSLNLAFRRSLQMVVAVRPIIINRPLLRSFSTKPNDDDDDNPSSIAVKAPLAEGQKKSQTKKVDSVIDGKEPPKRKRRTKQEIAAAKASKEEKSNELKLKKNEEPKMDKTEEAKTEKSEEAKSEKAVKPP